MSCPVVDDLRGDLLRAANWGIAVFFIFENLGIPLLIFQYLAAYDSHRPWLAGPSFTLLQGPCSGRSPVEWFSNSRFGTTFAREVFRLRGFCFLSAER